MKVKLKYPLQDFKNVLFLMLFLFPLLPIKITNTIFILYALLVLLLFLKEKHILKFIPFLSYGILTVPFIPYLIELCLYPNNSVLQFETEKKMLFFIAPFIFYADSRLKIKNDLAMALVFFISAMSLLSFVSVIYLLVQGKFILSGDPAEHAFHLRKAFEAFTGLHPTYYGLFSSIASLWILAIYKNYSKPLKIGLLFFLFFLILLNVFIASKMALFILVLGLLWLVYSQTLNKIKMLAYTSGIIAAIVFLVFFVPSFKTRFSEIPAFFANQSIQNTLVERLIIFNCSKSIFLSDLLTGVGARNAQALLDYCYFWCDFPKGANIHLNSHNQYLTLALNYGVGILLLFIGILVFLFLKNRTFAFAGIFWMATLLIMLSESILERQMGIYYFLFFGMLFQTYSNEYSQKVKNEIK